MENRFRPIFNIDVNIGKTYNIISMEVQKSNFEQKNS